MPRGGAVPLDVDWRRWRSRPWEATRQLQQIAKEAEPHGALRLLETMRKKRVDVDLVHCNAVLSAFARVGRWPASLLLLQKLPMWRLQPDLVSLSSALSGSWQHSLALLADFDGQPDTIAMNAFLGSLQRGRQWARAAQVLADMHSAGPAPDKISYNIAISACEEKWELGLELLAAMPRRRITPDPANCNAAMNVCGRARQWQWTLQLLQGLNRPNRISYNTAIAACSGQWRLALHLLDAGSGLGRWDSAGCSALLQGLAHGGRWSTCLALLVAMESRRVSPGDFDVAQALLAGAPDAALSMASAGRLSFNTALEQHSRALQWRNCLQLLIAMPARRIPPDAYSYGLTISSCDWQMALRLLGVMPARDLQPELKQFQAAAGVCAHAGQWGAILRLLHSLPRNTGTGGAAAVVDFALADCAFAAQGLGAAELLKACGRLRLDPDAAGRRGLAIKACGKARSWQLALSLDAAAEEEMLLAAGMAGQWEVVLSLLWRSAKPKLPCFNEALCTLQTANLWRQCFQLLADMDRLEVAPNFRSFLEVSQACERTGRWQEALACQQRVLQCLQRDEDPEHFKRALVMGLGWREALEAMDPERADLETWDLLMTSCRRSLQWQAVLDLFQGLQEQQLKPSGTSFRAIIDSAVSWSGSGGIICKGRQNVARNAQSTPGAAKLI
ncbi:unnamed protein product [Effrenium voratum]|nr:unnamed protein product [Effrenium voratum]